MSTLRLFALKSLAIFFALLLPTVDWAANTCESSSFVKNSKAILAACQSDLSKGCQTIDSCGRTNNGNKLDINRLPKAPVTCEQSLTCPTGQSLVCSTAYSTVLCMDTELKKDALGTPEGNQSYNTCKNYCESRGYRLPTNNEWLIAADGTVESNCLPGRPAVKPDSSSARAMADLSVNKPALDYPRPLCESKHHVHDMTGVLGQWVEDSPRPDPAFGRFNGGLWPQKASTIFYTTTAHHKSYSDYSIGCRCASEVNSLKP